MDKVRFLKDIGKRLRELRGKRTQEEICRALSKLLGEERTKEAYQHYEAGRRLVPIDVLWGLSVIYGVTVDSILSGKKKAAGLQKAQIITRFTKDILFMAELVESLTNEQKKAVHIILKSMSDKTV